MVQMNLFAKQKYSHGLENKLMVTKGVTRGWDELGEWDWHTHTTIYKIDN